MSVTLTEVREAFREETDGLLAKLENKPESTEAEAKLAQVSPGGKDDGAKVEMHAPALGGVVDGMDSLRIPVLNIALPVGSALVGGVAGIIVGDVIDIVVPPPVDSGGLATINLSSKSLLNTGAQIAGAGAVLKWGPGLMGAGPAKFAAGVMALRLILRVPAVSNFINRAGAAIAVPLAGVTARQPRANQGDVLSQAEQVIYGDDYFKDAL